MERKQSSSVSTAAILVPKTASGYFTTLSLKSYLSHLGISDIVVIEVQPCQLKQAKIPDEVEVIYVGGLGLKNCPLKDIQNFIKTYADKIGFWADNHPQHEQIAELSSKEKDWLYFDALDDQAPSCTSLLNKIWGDKIIRPAWVTAANHLENPTKYPDNLLVDQYKKVVYVAKVEDDSGHTHNYTEEVKTLYAKYLISGGSNKAEINQLLKKFDKIKNATIKAKERITLLHPEIPGFYVVNSGEIEQVEKDLLTAEATKLAAVHILAVQHYNLREEPVTTIMSSKVNLLSLFSGYQPEAKEANRIFIPGNHEDVLRQITERLIRTEFKIQKN